jgi:RNA polymerase sigma factor (sigma-70 family)
MSVPFDEHYPLFHSRADADTPETLLHRNITSEELKQALENMPVQWREVLVLRELEELSYREIADIANIPLGTVMFRLAWARKRLHEAFAQRRSEEASA